MNNAFSAVQQIAQRQGGAFTLSSAGLIRRLVDAGKIKSHDQNLQSKRIMVSGMRIRAIHVDASYIGIGAAATPVVAQAGTFVPPFGPARAVEEDPFDSDPFDDAMKVSVQEHLQNEHDARDLADEEFEEIFG